MDPKWPYVIMGGIAFVAGVLVLVFARRLWRQNQLAMRHMLFSDRWRRSDTLAQTRAAGWGFMALGAAAVIMGLLLPEKLR